MVLVCTSLPVPRIQIFEISGRFAQCDNFNVPRGQSDVFNFTVVYSVLTLY